MWQNHFSSRGYHFDKGMVCETKHTPQISIKNITGFTDTGSGDQTVTYESLSYCKYWKEQIEDMNVYELDKGEHRETIAMKDTFKIILHYCCKLKENIEEKPMNSVQSKLLNGTMNFVVKDVGGVVGDIKSGIMGGIKSFGFNI